MKTARVIMAVSVFGALLSSPVVLAAEQAEDKLGTVEFTVTAKRSAQTHVVRGVKLLHHMMYPEADRAFAAAAEADPACALAYWGRAMSLIHPLWPDVPTDEERTRGAEFIRVGLACPPATPREHAYLTTLDRFFNENAPGDYVARLKDLDEAWSVLAEAYPDDLDALAFSALYHLAPARFVAKDRSHRLQLEAARRLQAVAARIPDHPGAQHYKIHAYDFPLLADRALEVCDTYGSIAPEVPHALHMPTHIFTRRGLWDRSIEFNRRSAEAGRKLDAATGGVSSHVPHALDYMVYAHLQRGQYQAVDTIRRELSSLRGPYLPGGLMQIGFAFAAIPARYAVERQAWEEAAQLPLHQPSTFPWGPRFLNCDSMVHFARALGAVRSGQLDAARAEIAEQERVLRELGSGNRVSYWASQAETQLLTTRAWLLFATRQPDEALSSMRRAVELEATTDKEAVTPGEVIPAGDLLGEMLSEAGRHEEALAAFEAVLAASPNRLNTLFGAALAAEQAGQLDKARGYYEQVVNVAIEADPGIARVERARAFLARSPLPSTE